MENMCYLCYSMIHETSGNSATAGKASPTGNPVVKSGQEPVGRGKCRKLFREFGIPMVSVISKTGTKRVATSTHSWPSTKTYQSAEGQAHQAAAERSFGRWLSDRHVDVTACGRSNRPSIRHSVPSFPYLEAPWQHGVELPEAGTPSPATGRRKNCPLETVPMASYKKTRHNVGPIWPFLMKAAFCSFQPLEKRGLQKGKRRFFIISTNMTGYPPSAPLRYPRNESASLCISGIKPKVSTASMSEPFLHPCSNIFEDRWFCCGMAAPSTCEKRSNTLLPNIEDSKSNDSRRMLRSLTRRNMFGTRLTALLATARHRISQNLASCYALPSVKSEDLRNFFGPASTHLNYRGPDKFFHYLCKDQ